MSLPKKSISSINSNLSVGEFTPKFGQLISFPARPEIVTKVSEKITDVKIIHTPTKSELLENNAIRANDLLTSLLQSLAAREAIISTPAYKIF
jgi:hypothetical protein